MSDSIRAWVDTDEMRRLAETLIGRSEVPKPPQDVAFGRNFEGFAGERPAPPQQAPAQSPPPEPQAGSQREQGGVGPEEGDGSGEFPDKAIHLLKRAREEGMSGGVLQSRGTAPSPQNAPFRRPATVQRESRAEDVLKRPPAPSGDEPILKRVKAFGQWLKGPVGAKSYFISNTEGQIMIDEVGNPKLVQVARTLTGASSAGQGQVPVGSLHVRIGENAILEVVPTPSQYGLLILGLVMERTLSQAAAGEIRQGLQEVANARLIRR